MNRPNRHSFSKSLLFMAVFCVLIHTGRAAAQSGESQAVSGPLQPQPAPAHEVPNPFGIPPSMTVDEFNRHMTGAAAAALTLEEFVALRTREPHLKVLDTRAPQGFAYRHIKGAVNLPLTEMTEHTLPALLPDRRVPVVLVCDESFAPTRRMSMTLQAWPVLKANGYTRVYRLNLWRPEAEGASLRGPEEIEARVPLEGSFLLAPENAR